MTVDDIKLAAQVCEPSGRENCFRLKPPVAVVRRNGGDVVHVDLIDEDRDRVHLVGATSAVWHTPEVFVPYYAD